MTVTETTTREAARQANSAVAVKAAAAPAGVGVVLAVVLVVVGLWPVALLVLVAAGAAIALLPGWADGRILADLGAEEVTEAQAPRLYNVTDHLCVTHGLPRPVLRVVDDPACNAIAVGRSPAHASVVVTAGLLDALSPVALEGVLAEVLLRIERHDQAVGTTARWFPPAAGWGAPVDVLALDDEAVRLTRYPPGLIAALEQLRDHGVAVRRPGGAWATTWFAPPGPEGVAGAGPVGGGRGAQDPAPSLDDRIAALREL